jgi:hypothetical protein
MSRGLLPDDELAAISATFVDTIWFQRRVLELHPDMIAMRHGSSSTLPNAAVCLHDLASMLNESRYALFECAAHLAYYRPKGNEPAAVWHGQYYFADMTLRAYACGEHIAETVVAVRGLAEPDLKPYKAGVVSRQAVIGRYMIKVRPSDNLTPFLQRLHTSADWAKVLDYRNRWVHAHAPGIEGLGIQWNRGPRWKQISGGELIHGGGGDPPEASIDTLLDYGRTALEQLVECSRAVLEVCETLM